MFKLTKILPPVLITVMVVISFLSVQKDSAIMDEVAHIPAGYSYLKFQDYRLNPEHPPLLKILSAAPLLFLNLKFPLNHPAWTQDVNGQWVTGYQFLYHLGNDADQMLFWSRLPVIALLILLGIYLWKWSKELLGEKWALVVLFLYAFSPTIIAHSHYVTTDLAATCFIFIAFYYYVHYLKHPSVKTVIASGIALGFAQLAKFSAVLLLPSFALLGLIPLLFKKPLSSSWPTQIGKYVGRYILISFIALVVILIVYTPLVSNFSKELQQTLIRESIRPEAIESMVIKISNLPGARAFSQYLLGVVMVVARVGGGNTAYFLGEVSNQGWWYYFPVCFLLKETIPILILTGLALLFTIRKFIVHLVKTPKKEWFAWLKSYSLEHIAEIAMVLFIIVYGVTSIRGKLNIGVRHIMVIFPFLYLLITKEFSRRLFETKWRKLFKGVLIVLLVWILIDVVISYPHYLAYYNELVGGSRNGYKYITDSNLDWGQDLRRLAIWVDKNNIEKIKVDYFGGGVPSYYLGDKYIPWNSDQGPTTGWIAISANFFSESIYKEEATLQNSYYYLERLEPKVVIGHSIFVYYLPEK